MTVRYWFYWQVLSKNQRENRLCSFIYFWCNYWYFPRCYSVMLHCYPTEFKRVRVSMMAYLTIWPLGHISSYSQPFQIDSQVRINTGPNCPTNNFWSSHCWNAHWVNFAAQVTSQVFSPNVLFPRNPTSIWNINLSLIIWLPIRW